MWVLTVQDEDEMELYLETDSAYSFGRYESNDIVLKSQSASRNHLEIQTGEVKEADRADTGYITPLHIIIKSRAKTTINGEVYKLNKNEEEPMNVNFTHNMNNTITIIKTAIDPKTETSGNASVEITVKWVPLNILVNDKSAFFKERRLHGLLTKNKVDYRVTEDPFQATEYCSDEVEEGYNLWVSISRLLPIVNYEWVGQVLCNTKKLYEWKKNPYYKNFKPASISTENYESLLPNMRRNGLFHDIVFMTCTTEYEKFSRWVNLLDGEADEVDEIEFCDGTNGSKSYEDSLIDKISKNSNKKYLVVGLESTDILDEKQEIANQRLATFAQNNNSFILNKTEIHKAIIDCDISQMKFIEPRRVKPSRRKRYERINKLDLLDFSSQNNLRNDKDKLEQDTIESNMANRPINVRNLPEASLGSSRAAEEKESIRVTPGGLMQTSSKQIPQTRQRMSPSGSVYPNKKVVSTPAKKGYNPEDEKSLSATANNLSSVSIVEAIRSTKHKATETINDELGVSSNDKYDTTEFKGLASIETIDIPLRRKRQREDDNAANRDPAKVNFKKFKKHQKMRLSKPIVLTLSDPQANPYIIPLKGNFAADNRKNQEKLATDFQKEMDDVKGYSGSLTTNMNNDKTDDLEVENSLFVPIDSQSQKQDVPKPPYAMQVEEEPQRVKTSNRFFDRAPIVDNHDEEDDEEDDEDQLRFGFRRS